MKTGRPSGSPDPLAGSFVSASGKSTHGYDERTGKDMKENPTPYGSAHDLPSIIEMRQMLAGMKFLTRIVARERRQSILQLEQKMIALCDLVDRFYDVLGERHWIFTDHLHLSAVESLFANRPSASEAEAGIIDIVASRLHGSFWHIGLFGHEAMRARRTNLERARQHYLDEQWDSCALVLVAAMDGFVNDVEVANRKGLHARDPEEMVVWDNVAGHHKGLAAVMSVFRRPISKRRDEQVFEVHRHGIVHGTIVNYNNQVVATKAWNMLFAVADWATAKEKHAQPTETPPTVAGTFAMLMEHVRYKRYSESFEPWQATTDQKIFADLAVVKEASKFLDSWHAGRWAIVAESLPPSALRRTATVGDRAVAAKRIFAPSPLADYAVTGVSFPRASVAVLHGTATIGSETGRIEIRWMHESANGRLSMPNDTDSRWVLAVYAPHTFLRT